MLNNEFIINLLQELIYAYGPCGQEHEVRIICERELKKYCDDVWVDESGNVIGHMLALHQKRDDQSIVSPIRVMAHMDELSMMVKRVEANGTLRVINLGGLKPSVIGQGPVDILADDLVLPGVLSLGPQHSSRETSLVDETKNKPLDWSHVHIFTNKSVDELKAIGVHPGTRVVISRERRKLFCFGNCIGGYFMDDRAAITISLIAASLLREENCPHHEIYFVMTTEEERDGIGAAYSSRTLPGELTLAVEIGPISNEYGTEFRKDPIVSYGDSRGLYTKSVADKLVRQARSIGLSPQTAVWESFCSDASVSKSYGQAASIALLSIPTLNTHGFEIIHSDGIQACAKLLTAFLQEPWE